MIERKLENVIIDRMFKRKVIIVLGARQVGKTTLLKSIVRKTGIEYIWLDGDEPDVRSMLSNASSTKLKKIIGKYKLVVIDEAQRINNIGLSAKLIVDNFKDIQVLLSGSSALDIANELKEPLTGRKYEYTLFPISFDEMIGHSSLIEETRLLENRLIYGSYPDVILSNSNEIEILGQLTTSYLYKDIFSYNLIKKPTILEKLLQALALQIGNEVSFNEIGQLIGLDPTTVERYVDLLEKAYVVFRLNSLSRNMRNEIKKGKKIYFYDLGIRNAIIKSFSSLELRVDKGALWENYLISERMKYNHYNIKYLNMYFWRTHSQQEIDYIEEEGEQLSAYEFKWNPRKKAKFSKSFLKAYKNSNLRNINIDNYFEFIS